MVASNTRECFRVFVGQRVTGLLFDALPVGHQDIARGTKTLVFEDGRGLTIASNGSFWTESAGDVQCAIRERHIELMRLKGDVEEVLALAGASPQEGS